MNYISTNRFAAWIAAMSVAALTMAQTSPADISGVMADISAKSAKVSSFSATVETGEEADGPSVPGSTSSLLVSRELGWKMLGKEGNDAYQLVTDFSVFYQYYPGDKRVLKTVADKPEILAMLKKPATDMNPVSLLDPSTVKFLGTESFENQTVYKVTGTTQSQMMPGGPVVTRTLTALISTEDGLPRKTLESVGVSTGTTVYRNVKINEPVQPEDFKFVPPEGATVIDTNEQMRRMEAELKAAPPANPGTASKH